MSMYLIKMPYIFRAVVGLARMKFVKPAEQILIVKLDKMTGLSADVKLVRS